MYVLDHDVGRIQTAGHRCISQNRHCDCSMQQLWHNSDAAPGAEVGHRCAREAAAQQTLLPGGIHRAGVADELLQEDCGSHVEYALRIQEGAGAS